MFSLRPLVRTTQFAQPWLLRSAPAVGRGFRATTKCQSEMADAIVAKNKERGIMLYSKTYCPYCSQVKSMLGKANLPFTLVELDDLADGDAVQDALSEVSGMRTVPQVFIAGELVGGCDDTMDAMSNGKFQKLAEAAGVSADSK